MSSSGRGAWRRERACSAAKARSCAKYAAESPSVPGARVCPARKSASPNVTSSSDARLPRSEERCPARKSASPNVPEHLHCSRPQTLAPALSMTAATSSLLLPSANAALPANIEAWSAAPSPCCQCLSISPRVRITAAAISRKTPALSASGCGGDPDATARGSTSASDMCTSTGAPLDVVLG